MISLFKNQPRIFSCVLFSFFIVLYVLPIILTGRLYIDDLGRTLYGYSGWGLNGRPLSDAIMQTMSLGGELLDLSPLNQILSVLLLCITLYYYTEKVFSGINFSGLLILCFLFISNPFYIENLSYRFDSLTMALSMVLLILPYTISGRRYIIDLFGFADYSFTFSLSGIYRFICYLSSDRSCHKLYRQKQQRCCINYHKKSTTINHIICNIQDIYICSLR